MVVPSSLLQIDESSLAFVIARNSLENTMKFFGLFARGAAGSAVATFLFSALLFFLAVGVLPVVPLLIQAVITGVTFGIFYSVVHMNRTPSFLSSFGTGVGYGVVNLIVSIVLGTAAALSLGTIIGVAVMGLLLGGGAFLATKIGGGAR
jgi:Na+-transporting NADH:ubiquinone oxidoreductase subunit NqrD